ncbi:putative PEP-binding protein [Candidatus Bipolaricaulota bacterium]
MTTSETRRRSPTRKARRKWKAHCLGTQNCYGVYAEASSKPTKSITSNLPVILALDHSHLARIIEWRESREVVGVVARCASLIDHFAGYLFDKGIQLAVCESFPRLEEGTLVSIQGGSELIVDLQGRSGINGVVCPGGSAFSDRTRGSRQNPLSAFRLLADVTTPEEIRSARIAGAAGIGILRTEWLGWESLRPPTWREHYAFYSSAAQQVPPGTLNVRLLDIGGDKIPLWAIAHSHELASPLGLRGLRAREILEDAFASQETALQVLASSVPGVGILIPMITSPEEVVEYREAWAGTSRTARVRFGAMIETPSAALSIGKILDAVDFIRIGLGDLAQFTLAKERSRISADEYSGHRIHPSILELVEKVVRACRCRGVPAMVCPNLEPREGLVNQFESVGIDALCLPARSSAFSRTLPHRPLQANPNLAAAPKMQTKEAARARRASQPV